MIFFGLKSLLVWSLVQPASIIIELKSIILKVILFKLFAAMFNVKSSEELRLMEYCPAKFTVPTDDRQHWHFICTLKLCRIKVVCPCFASFDNLILTLQEIS